MIAFASMLRSARRPRRAASVASVVRAFGTVRISDHPDVWPTLPIAEGSQRPVGSATQTSTTRPEGEAGRR